MTRILAVANVKGGVGKTTSAVNLAAALVERGRRVLMVDLDPQASLTLSLGIQPDQVKATIRNLLDWGLDAVDPTIAPIAENWDLIPSNDSLRGLELELGDAPRRIFLLGAALQPLRERYDYMVLDCPANAGVLTGMALAAADEVIIPLTPDYLAFRVSGGIVRIIQEVQKRINPRLRMAGIILNMYDSRRRHARDVFTALRDTYGSEIPFFSAVVHDSVRLKEAPSAAQSIITYAPQSQAADAYRIIAGEIDAGVHEPIKDDAAPAAAPGLDESAPAEPLSSYLEFRRETEINPTSVNAWLGRAETAPTIDETIHSLASALQLEPASEAIRGQLGRRLEDRVLDCGTSEVSDLMLLAQHFIDIGEPGYADKLYTRATELAPFSEDAWLGRAATTDSTSERIIFMQRCLEANPENARALAALEAAKQELKDEGLRLVQEASRLAQSGQVDQAHALFKQAIELDPFNSQAWLGCARTADNLPAKLSYAKQARQLDPHSAEARDFYSVMNKFVRGSPQERWTVDKEQRGFGGLDFRIASIGLLLLIIVIMVFVLPLFTVH